MVVDVFVGLDTVKLALTTPAALPAREGGAQQRISMKRAKWMNLTAMLRCTDISLAPGAGSEISALILMVKEPASSRAWRQRPARSCPETSWSSELTS